MNRKLGWIPIQAILICIICLCATARAEVEVDYVLDSDGKTRIPIPLTYTVNRVIKNLDSAGQLQKADDIFIDSHDDLYVADTCNNRIVKMDKYGKVKKVYTGPKDKPLGGPTGVYVDEYGDLFIGDTLNNRILHLTPEGEFVEQFVKPDSPLLSEHYDFGVSKVFLTPTGLIYVLKGKDFLLMDANNEFKGFVGANEVGFDFRRMLIRMFASRGQKDRIQKVEPPSYANFIIADDGSIYATSLKASTNQIKKLNTVGKNVFRHAFYGEKTIDDNGKLQNPVFVDICMNKAGIITVVDSVSGKLYQYDGDGNLLAVFGGKGKVKGKLELPSSLALDSSGNIYVLDRMANCIQVFEPTAFTKSIHNAVSLFTEGYYDKALTAWEEVLMTDGNYKHAHAGIGKLLVKKEQWKEAMEEYRLADSKEGYSEAFNGYRHQIFRDNFLIVTILVIVIFISVYTLVIRLKALTDDDSYRKAGYRG